jgi:hypothetical protein
MLVSLIAAFLVATPGSVETFSVKPVPGGMAAAVFSAERIALPSMRGPLRLQIEALQGAIELETTENKEVLLRQLSRLQGGLCPVVESFSGGVRMRCTTKQIDAQLVIKGGNRYLDLFRLRGIPVRPGDEGPPSVFYSPEKFDLGDSCPGSTDASKAECAFIAGHHQKAQKAIEYLQNAFASRPSYAALRLGDIALAAKQTELAIAWYKKGQLKGNFGRLALARECELTGSCFSRINQTFESAGLPEPMRTEMELRHARTLILLGKGSEAAMLLTERFRASERLAVTDVAPMLCKKMVLAILHDPQVVPPMLPIALYLALPNRGSGSLAHEMVHVAANRAESLGAPEFGANLLAATTSQVPASSISDHLARIAEMYLAAKDRIRAGVIVEYAQTQLSMRQLAGAKWKTIVGGLTASEVTQHPVLPNKIDPSANLAQVEQVLARARTLRSMEAR